MNLERIPSSGSLRIPILKPSASINNNAPNASINLTNGYDEKLKNLQNDCAKDYTLHAIVYNKELMKRLKRE